MFTGARLRITVTPYSELYNQGYVDINPGMGHFFHYDEGDRVYLDARVLFEGPGIEFEGWYGPDGDLVSQHTGELIMRDRLMRVEARFKVESGVAVYDKNEGKWQEEMSDTISEAIGGGHHLRVFPGKFFEKDITIDFPGVSLKSLLGPEYTTIERPILITSRNFGGLEGFTLDPGQDETAITFDHYLNQEVMIKDNIFQSGQGVLFERDIRAPLTIDSNEFRDQDGLIFEDDLNAKVLVQDNDFRGPVGIFFHQGIHEPLTIKDNSFRQNEEAVLFFGSLEQKIEILDNEFHQVGVGVNFPYGVKYFHDILIEDNSFLDSKIGLFFDNYQSYFKPALEIKGNDFYNNSDIAIHFISTENLNLNDPRVHYNNFEDNNIALGAGKGISYASNGELLLDARYNWWNCPDGPSPYGEGDPVEGPVMVDPWSSSSH